MTTSVTPSSIAQLAPTAVWQWFADICAVPHPTFHEHKLGELIIEAVKTRGQAYGLTVQQDAKGNILIQKPASRLDPAMAQRPRVAIQAHFDMVAQKGRDSSHDFVHDPIKPMVKDGWVWATDTTLGADNGIGLAMALAVAFSDDIAHPPLDIVLTCEEEVGMGGVQALSPDWLTAPRLINLDSEDEGELFVGCAGGRDATLQLTMPWVTAEHTTPVAISVAGLQGGHSGIDIHKGLGNANLLLARVLATLFAVTPLQLHSWQGGVLRNVITREATAVVLGDRAQITHHLPAILATLQAELHTAEPTLTLTAEPVSLKHPLALSLADSKRVLDILRSLPNGVLRMSDDFAGVVETSMSTGVVTLAASEQADNAQLTVHCLMRSLLQTTKDDVSQRLQALAELAGATLVLSDDYPGWQPDPDSPLLDMVSDIMTRHFVGTPKLQVIHAGLECGILKGKAPNMDMISFGPNIRAAHSPNERVEIASVAKTWQVLVDVLKAL